MLFNSLDFALFLPIVFCLYWFVVHKNLRLQNLFLVLVSYIFYGWWDWRFLSLILFSTSIDFLIGRRLAQEKHPSKRKLLLWMSLIVNLGLLGCFKYFNFFVDNFVTAFAFFGQEISARALDIILPVGISFYTFQTLSYTIDVYKRRLKPTKDFVAFAAFVSFFPQLVAGPIERASHLLPQFYRRRFFNYPQAVDGLRQIIWGLFKKLVIADNAALIVNEIFSNSTDYSGSTLLIGALFFAFQIYGDFSGYSDIAIGTARLFGFDLKQNFAFPYFSRDIAEFWRRWHISLSTWFRDYLYIPLGGSRGSTWFVLRNVALIFIVSGFWHGAKWTFIIWGALNALYFLPLVLRKKHRTNLDTVAQGKLLPSLKECMQMGLTFTMTVLAWVFFRAESIEHAISCLSTIFSKSLFTMPYAYGIGMQQVALTLIFILIMSLIEWFGRMKKHALELGTSYNTYLQWTLLYLLAICIFLFGQFQQDFIYFQF